MATARTPSGTRIYMQSAIGSAQVVSAITKDNPGVVTYVGTDPTNGDYIAFTDMFGMTELEGAMVKAANVVGGSNTFEMEDQNTTGYGTFSTGNMQVVTLGTEIGDGTGLTISGFEQQFAEYNLLRDRITRRVPTVVSGGNIEVPMIWDPTTAAAAALLVAADTAQRLGFKVLFPDGLEMLFFGYIGASGLPNVGSSNEIMQTNISISMDSRPRYVLP